MQLFLCFLDAQEANWAQETEIDGRSYTRILDGMEESDEPAAYAVSR